MRRKSGRARSSLGGRLAGLEKRAEQTDANLRAMVKAIQQIAAELRDLRTAGGSGGSRIVINVRGGRVQVEREEMAPERMGFRAGS
jgi:Tfp pilus assembly protein FimT